MLTGDGFLAARGCWPTNRRRYVPRFDPQAPLAPRNAHFPAKAKRVLMIFCSGACSHLDTWDYKPELIKRHDTPMPGSDKLVTFQGKSGNLIQSPWQFKPRGQSGKYVSDLLPNLAELADEMCFIHSMTSKTNTHGPGENFMSTGFTVEGYPSAGAWVYLCPGERVRQPAGLRGDPRSARRAAGRAEQLVERFLAGRVSGHGVQRRTADRQPGHAARDQPRAAERSTRDFLKLLNDKHLARNPRRQRTGGAHRQL